MACARAILLVLLSTLAVTAGAVEPVPTSEAEDLAKLKAAADAAEAEFAAFEGSDAAAKLAASFPTLMDALQQTDDPVLKDTIDDLAGMMAGELLGHDVKAALGDRYGGRRDSQVEDFDQRSEGGELYLFWALDAPGVETHAEAFQQLAETMPAVALFDTHMLPIKEWLIEIKLLEQAKDRLMNLGDQADAGPMAQSIFDDATANWRGFTRMSRNRRDGGYLLVEDVSLAHRFGITRLPSVVYRSPMGLLHRIDGAMPADGLAAWISHCLAWEAANQTVLEQRLEALQ